MKPLENPFERLQGDLFRMEMEQLIDPINPMAKWPRRWSVKRLRNSLSPVGIRRPVDREPVPG